MSREQTEQLLPSSQSGRRLFLSSSSSLFSLNARGAGAVSAAAAGDAAGAGDGVESYEYRSSDSAAELAARGGGKGAAEFAGVTVMR